MNTLLLPVELQRVNHTASTNSADSTRQNTAHPTIETAMSNSNFIEPSGMPQDTASTAAQEAVPEVTPQALPDALLIDPVIDRVVERVEQLLLRYEELQHTNALLSGQVNALTHERDSLKSRLSAARARVDALLERLPENAVASLQPSSSSGP